MTTTASRRWLACFTNDRLCVAARGSVLVKGSEQPMELWSPSKGATDDNGGDKVRCHCTPAQVAARARGLIWRVPDNAV